MTSFPVSHDKTAILAARMQALSIFEGDLVENFIRGSGAGGQKINKTSVCVQLTHTPTGITVRCQESRSQALNRFIARREICDRIEERLTGKVQKREALISKIRRRKAKRARKTKEKILRDKSHRKTKNHFVNFKG